MTDHVAITAPTLTEPQLFSALHPELAAWFAQRFTHFSPAQRATVPEILAGHSTLLSAPTGSGKTLAAFLGVFDYLAKLHAADALPNDHNDHASHFHSRRTIWFGRNARISTGCTHMVNTNFKWWINNH